MNDWQELYNAAILETDWKTMPERVQAAGSAILARRRNLSDDHGGRPEEVRALTAALECLETLRTDAVAWKSKQPEASKSF
jgi:hypothetical protein